ncbi:hypothetical protein HYZ41_00320 [archaeon]|nr:hypothetical protein [archaeon]
MKKIMIAVLMFVLMGTAAFAVTVDRSMPSSVDPSSSFTVSFNINPEGTLTGFDLADFVPNGWNLNDWSVTGYLKSDITYDSQSKEYQGATRNVLHWKFNKNMTSAATLTYTMSAPSTTGTYDLIALWLYPGGFNSKTSSLAVGTQQAQPQPQPQPEPQPPVQVVCGNNAVESGEECDGTDLSGQTCITKGFQAGTLKCTNCRFDSSECGSIAPVPGFNLGADQSMTVYAIVAIVIIAVAGYWYYRKPKKVANV